MEPVPGFTKNLSFELALISRGKLTLGTIPGQQDCGNTLRGTGCALNHQMDMSLFRSRDEMLLFKTCLK